MSTSIFLNYYFPSHSDFFLFLFFLFVCEGSWSQLLSTALPGKNSNSQQLLKLPLKRFSSILSCLPVISLIPDLFFFLFLNLFSFFKLGLPPLEALRPPLLNPLLNPLLSLSLMLLLLPSPHLPPNLLPSPPKKRRKKKRRKKKRRKKRRKKKTRGRRLKNLKSLR